MENANRTALINAIIDRAERAAPGSDDVAQLGGLLRAGDYDIGANLFAEIIADPNGAHPSGHGHPGLAPAAARRPLHPLGTIAELFTAAALAGADGAFLERVAQRLLRGEHDTQRDALRAFLDSAATGPRPYFDGGANRAVNIIRNGPIGA